jgi:hypothetical protein
LDVSTNSKQNTLSKFKRVKLSQLLFLCRLNVQVASSDPSAAAAAAATTNINRKLVVVKLKN